MARKVNRLSALGVSKLMKPGYYPDGNNLYLQVSGAGAKSWIFRYTINARQREMGLGPFHTVDLTTARAKARECRGLLLEGKDPIEVRHAASTAAELAAAKRTTFDQCATAYISAHRASWKNAKHVSQWENTIGQYVSPTIGSLPVDAIDTNLVLRILTPIGITKLKPLNVSVGGSKQFLTGQP